MIVHAGNWTEGLETERLRAEKAEARVTALEAALKSVDTALFDIIQTEAFSNANNSYTAQVARGVRREIATALATEERKDGNG